MIKLVILRHGESTWNKENLFTGWTDVGLSDRGFAEAHSAGKIMLAEGFKFDVAYTSVLKRAIKTLWIALEEMDLMWIPILNYWRLNERHYGALQGLNKAETAAKYGEEQVKIWRRSYATPPPALEKMDKRYPGFDPIYKNLDEKDIPVTESLKNTVERFLPFWHDVLAPDLKTGRKILVAAHGNSLRALAKYLDNISEDNIVGLNIPTGVPLVYELDENLKPIKTDKQPLVPYVTCYPLGDPEEIARAQKEVENQGKKRPN